MAGEQFQTRLADSEIVFSMSKRGDRWENVAMGNFFSMLKTERQAIAHYDEHYPHSALGYRSPREFRRLADSSI